MCLITLLAKWMDDGDLDLFLITPLSFEIDGLIRHLRFMSPPSPCRKCLGSCDSGNNIIIILLPTWIPPDVSEEFVVVLSNATLELFKIQLVTAMEAVMEEWKCILNIVLWHERKEHDATRRLSYSFKLSESNSHRVESCIRFNNRFIPNTNWSKPSSSLTSS